MAKIGNTKSNTLLIGTSGNDSIKNGGRYNYLWHQGGSYVTINGGAGNDYIYNNGSYVIINGGDGNDSIGHSSGNLKTTITGGLGDDYIYGWGDYLTIEGGDGNDSIDNYGGSNVTINAGAGNDLIVNGGSNVTIDAGTGDDYVYNHKDNVTIDSGAGNDEIYNWGDDVTINAGAGNDKIMIESASSNVTINAGAGNDKISLGSGSKYNVIKYAEGDGNDTIRGFNSDDTLQIAGSYTTVQSGSDLMVYVGDGSIKLKNKSTANIVTIQGDEEISETNTWKVSGTTATYGTSSKTLITITGLKSGTSTNNISLSGKTVTLKAAALSTSKVTITGDYKLALAGDVQKSVTTNKKWSVSGSVATYKSGGTTAGYKLASDSKSITYQTKSGGSTLATITGLKSGTSVNNISTSGNTVTLKAAALSTSKVTIGGDYKLALAGDVQKSKTTSAKWTKSNGIAKYISAKTSAGYKLASDSKSISYISGSGGQQIIKITGLKNNASTAGISLSNKIVTVAANAVADGKTVSVTGAGYKFKLNGTSGRNTLQGGAGNDTLTGGGGADTFIYTGGDDIITDYAAQDKISVVGGYSDSTISGNDIILTTNKGTLTIKNSANNDITVNGEIKNFSDSLPAGLSYSDDGFTLIVGNNFTGGTIDLSKYADVMDVDASNYRRMDLKITGNNFNNSLVGGSGADTIGGGKGSDILTGGYGRDIFVHSTGNDIITDYIAGEDKIKLKNTKITDIKTGDNNVVFTTSTGTLTVQNAAGRKITIIDSSGNETTQRYSPNISEIIAEKSVGEFEFVETENNLSAVITYSEK